MDVGNRSTSHASSQISESEMPICKTAILPKVKELGQAENTSVSNVSVPSAAEESDKDEDLSNDDEDEEDHLGDDQSETINIDTLLQRICHLRTLEDGIDQ